MPSQPKPSKILLANSWHWQMPPPTWRFLLIVVLVIGIIFRLANLDNKVLWWDEHATIFKISGYTREEWNSEKNKLNGHIISLEDFRKSYGPNSQSNVADTIKLLALQDSKHTPLYFSLLRLWVDWFGNSATTMRSLSALISLLIFSCLYWLCLELFQSSLVGSMAVALIAVSPFHLLSAQEARPYSLLATTILLSSVTLLRALRLKTKTSWGLYILSCTLSIYTHTLSLFVFIAHAIYIFATYGSRRTPVSLVYLISTLLGLLTFTPWLFFILTNSQLVSKSLEWQHQIRPFSSLVKGWLIYLSRIFLDFNPISDTNSTSFQDPLSIFLRWFLLILVGYSIYFLCHHSPRRIWLFLLPLIGIPSLALAIPDLIFGGFRSWVARYLIASYLGIHLAVAYLLTTKIASSTSSLWRQTFWSVVTVVLISGGAFSCATISPAATWWNKYSDKIPLAQISSLLNQDSYPLLLFESHSRHQTISISPLLTSKVRLLQLGEFDKIIIPDDFSDIFLLNPSEQLQDKLQKKPQFKLEPIYHNHQESSPNYSLWRLTN